MSGRTARPLSPWEAQVHSEGLREEHAFLSRIHVGQISKVEEATGIIHVVCPALNHQVPTTIPLSGLSVAGFSSSWIRHMPRVNDFVLIGFGPDNQPEVLAVTCWGDNPSSTTEGVFIDRKLGYARIAKLATDSTNDVTGEIQNADGSTTSQQIGLDEFVPLRGGEWDMRSAGGAYIHGSKFGQLTLSAGSSVLKVDKPRLEVRGQTGLYSYESEKSNLHFGDVKRVLQPNSLPASVNTPGAPFNPVLPGKAWELHLAGSVGGLVELPMYDLLVGDVRTGLGTPETPLLPPAPIRISETVYGIDGLTVGYDRTMDTLGNWDVTTSLATTQSYTAPLSTLEVELAILNLTTNAAANVTVGAALNVTSAAAMSLSAGAALSLSSTLATTIASGAALTFTSALVMQLAPTGVLQLGSPAATSPSVHGSALVTLLGELATEFQAIAQIFDPLLLDPKAVAFAGVATTITQALAIPPAPGNALALLSAKTLVD